MTGPIDYQAVLADLKARRRQLDSAIASIESILGAVSAPMDQAESAVKFNVWRYRPKKK